MASGPALLLRELGRAASVTSGHLLLYSSHIHPKSQVQGYQLASFSIPHHPHLPGRHLYQKGSSYLQLTSCRSGCLACRVTTKIFLFIAETNQSLSNQEKIDIGILEDDSEATSVTLQWSSSIRPSTTRSAVVFVEAEYQKRPILSYTERPCQKFNFLEMSCSCIHKENSEAHP